MTDQFQFENPEDDATRDDQPEPDRALVDRGLEDTLDEGYAPPDRWSTASPFGTTVSDPTEDESLEQRLEQEEPEVEDDWDDESVGEDRDPASDAVS